MSKHLFLYRVKDSDDRDCCAYIDAAGPKFECNHYFSSIRLCGSCYSGGKFPEYEEIETILTKDEYEEIISFNIFIKALNSDEALAFFEKIQKSEMKYLKKEYNLSDRNIEEIFNEYAEDFRDRSIVSYVYDDSEEAGREEAWQLGYVKDDDPISSKYFDYEKFGEDLVEYDEYFIMLILTTKLKNAINKKKPGMEFSLHQISVNGNKRGTSGWIRNPENNSVVYVDTEGIKWNGRPRQYMYRYADDMKDTHGYHNRWATSLEELVNGITELLLFPVSEVKDLRI